MLDDEYFRMFSAENSFWWYVALREFLGHELKLLSVGRDREVILDAGCGTGANLKLVNNRGLAVGLDISRVALQLAKSTGAEQFGSWICSIVALCQQLVRCAPVDRRLVSFVDRR